MRARTCQGLSTGAVTKSLYSGNWQASQFGHELTLANGCFAVAAQGSRSRRPATGPACVAVSGRRLWRDSRLGGERDGHGVEQLARSHHRVSRRTEFLKVRRLNVRLVCSRVAVDLKHAHEAGVIPFRDGVEHEAALFEAHRCLADLTRRPGESLGRGRINLQLGDAQVPTKSLLSHDDRGQTEEHDG